MNEKLARISDETFDDFMEELGLLATLEELALIEIAADLAVDDFTYVFPKLP